MKKVIAILLTAIFCLGASGCSVMGDAIADRSSGRQECILKEQDATLFSYDDTEYRILEESRNKNQLGSWVGFIRKLAVLDQKNAVLELRELNFSDLKTSLPDKAASVIQFLNIYKDKEDGSHLIIDVNGTYHKAVPKDKAGDEKIIHFEALKEKSDGEIVISTDNCTHIRYGTNLYQITDQQISEDTLNSYLGVIGTAKVFDTKTKQEIPKDKLKKTELQPGELSRQRRVSWTYGTVFSISDTDKGDSIAIEINNRYLKANRIK